MRARSSTAHCDAGQGAKHLTTKSKKTRLPRRGLHLLGEARWLLGYALVVETAFQTLLRVWSEVLEFFLFVAITGGFLVATLYLKGFKGLVGMATDTWTQRLAALFLLALALSFLWGDHSIRSGFATLRLPTYLIIIAMVVETLRREERIRSFAWTILGAVCLLYMLTAIEFCFGSDVLGLKCADVPNCLERRVANWHWSGFFYKGPGHYHLSMDPRILKITIIGEAYGVNRLGLFFVLAYALGIGIVLQSDRTRPKLIVMGLATIVLSGVLLSCSRSAGLAVLILYIVFVALIALNTRAFHWVKLFTFASLPSFVAMVLLWQVLPIFTTFDRFITVPDSIRPAAHKLGDIGERGFRLDSHRLKIWELGLDYFFANPVGGRGFRTMEFALHSGYLELLAETGLLGLLPFLALLAYALAVMLRSTLGPFVAATLWKITFLSMFIVMLAVNLVDTYLQDRYFWVVLGYAAVLETESKPDDSALGTNRL